MKKAIESLHDLEGLKALLMAESLPSSDLGLSPSQKFFGIYEESVLVATTGVECYGPDALLRSLAVLASRRHQGLARQLVSFAEDYAARQGIVSLYLLTTTAEGFFTRLGYAKSSREHAPPAILASAQFSRLCPISSAFLSKSIKR